VDFGPDFVETMIDAIGLYRGSVSPERASAIESANSPSLPVIKGNYQSVATGSRGRPSSRTNIERVAESSR
jgi:hypothetical protein